MLVGTDLTVQRGALTALQSVSLELRPGQVFGVLGPNGAGKSTLLAALSGDVRPSVGRVVLHGRALGDWPDVERARCLAVLPQSSTLNFGFRVVDVVAMGRLPHRSGREADAAIVSAALIAADVQHLATRSYLKLSGGERQRVHLARVLAQLWPGGAGQALLLDEPTSMLDPAHQHSILQAVRGFAEQGGAALVILHDLNLAARYCDRLLLLKDGRPIAAGSPDEVMQAQPVRAVFGLDVLVQRHPELGHPLIIAR
ncbi:hemin importer ATP-binding subunit [Stutzerimonas stutzeri ATCC 14405 = CCUG 16156]|uniref:heme ABC transporter ATP-binding protein n=1 Tax=Stutzerimonas stutzeri TaxID=316 RepID=UPI0002549535|nr:heme ABC transporter ATP-binding protein [Stutzerimonas stutzeri]EHY75966.1 hemin importer ATP-binding subunit [Stutzerimonas stutzeri ATCC 14405 = CCUG 16156]MDH2247531.1 heme ABC transporter ATP-binding protein [Pseudomonas sp. GD03856]MDH2266466.1 heme ABC transporter ATP-binding protein [Pseudomonas sp. GD03855]QOZ94818.1 heme ABC transporter ATP-binding protein [Stutzerimonas stutzeri]